MQMLFRCFLTAAEGAIGEMYSVNTLSLDDDTRPVGEVNALVDEILVVVELLMGAAPSSLAADDVRRLLGFMVDCPQPNQIFYTVGCGLFCFESLLSLWVLQKVYLYFRGNK